MSGGIAWDAFRDAYLDPNAVLNLSSVYFGIPTTDPNPKKTLDTFIYANGLVRWLAINAPAEYRAAGFDDAKVPGYRAAYAIFQALPVLRQEAFLEDIYFQELIATARPEGLSYLKYFRAYKAVNTLFPAGLGYTKNTTVPGLKSGSTVIPTGDLDLRLSSIVTFKGGNIDLAGPGGRALIGPISRSTSTQEGVITYGGGSIFSFTDADFLVNQSRVLTRNGGDIAIFSSNGNISAGQGPKTTSSVPPVVLFCDTLAFCTEDQVASTTGAGLKAYKPLVANVPLPNAYLITPRGFVDFGDAGAVFAGDLSVAALFVLNGDNVQVAGSAVGLPAFTAVNTGALTNAGNVSGAAGKEAVPPKPQTGQRASIIIVDIIGFGGEDRNEVPRGECPGGTPKADGKCPTAAPKETGLYDKHSPVQIVGYGPLSADAKRRFSENGKAALAQ